MVFHYHEGMADAEKGEEGPKETIEEVFRSWHRESESESGVHLEFELEHGRSGKSDANDATPGNEEADIEETGQVIQRATTTSAGRTKRATKPISEK